MKPRFSILMASTVAAAFAAIAHGQPANNNCANAIAVANQSVTAWNPLGATQSVVLPCDNFPDGAIDVWYSYTTAGPETVTVTTCGGATEFTSVGVYASCGGTLVACDSWSCGTTSQSEVTFQAPGAATYYICLVGYADFEGPGYLAINRPITVPPPPNDTCATAQLLTGPGNYPFDSAGAATDGPSGVCNINSRPDTHDVYFRYTPASNGWVRFDTLQDAQGQRLNTTIQVFDGCGGSLLACNDDANWTGVFSGLWVGSLTCPLQVTAGTNYIIRVASSGAGSAGGKGILRLSPVAGPIVYASPAHALLEPGPDCDDDYESDVNYGCNTRVTPPTYRAQPLQLCDTYKGHIYQRTTTIADGTLIHDFDAYQLTLTAPDTIRVIGQTQFVGTVTLFKLPCGTGTVYSGQLGQYPNPECGAGEFDLTWTLPAGEYQIGFGTAVINQPICGQSNEYWFTVTGTSPCPAAIVSCCRGTTCNSIAAGTCTGTVAGSASVTVALCGSGSAMATCCYADFNHDGTQSIDDLFLYFNAYFTGSPWANFAGNGVEQPTIDDLFLYINAYFTGCT